MREEYKKLVREEYWGDFASLLKTRDCSDGFKEYMNSDEDCQKAVDLVLNRMAKRLREIWKPDDRKSRFQIFMEKIFKRRN